MLRLHSIFSDSFPLTERIALQVRRVATFAACVAALTGLAIRGMAQKDELPYAPAPQVSFFRAGIGPDWHLAFLGFQNGVGVKPTDMSPVGHEPQDPPITSMFRHSDDASWWLSGQANIIYQGRLPFIRFTRDQTASATRRNIRRRWWERSTRHGGRRTPSAITLTWCSTWKLQKGAA